MGAVNGFSIDIYPLRGIEMRIFVVHLENAGKNFVFFHSF
jgi:hypothetical protein